MQNCEHVMSNDPVDGHHWCVKCDWTPDEGVERREPIYGGPNRSGVCICGHSWEDHHLGMVVRLGRYLTTDGHREYSIPQECEYFGCNEDGGLDADGNPHCFGYQDSLAPSKHA